MRQRTEGAEVATAHTDGQLHPWTGVLVACAWLCCVVLLFMPVIAGWLNPPRDAAAQAADDPVALGLFVLNSLAPSQATLLCLLAAVIATVLALVVLACAWLLNRHARPFRRVLAIVGSPTAGLLAALAIAILFG